MKVRYNGNNGLDIQYFYWMQLSHYILLPMQTFGHTLYIQTSSYINAVMFIKRFEC